MNLFTRNSPYYHLLKYLLFLLKHPVYIYIIYIYVYTYRVFQEELLEYKRNLIQRVNRMPRNRLPRVMKRCSPTGRRNHGRPLKRLLVTWDRNGSSGPTPWQIWWWWWWWYICVCVCDSVIILLPNYSYVIKCILKVGLRVYGCHCQAITHHNPL